MQENKIEIAKIKLKIAVIHKMKTLGEKDRKIRILLVFSWYFTYNDFIKMMDGCPSIFIHLNYDEG